MHRSGSFAEKRVEPAGQLRAVPLPASGLSPLDAQPVQPGPRVLQRLDGGYAMVAFSRAMRELRGQMEQVADTDAPVLLLGEGGTGKELAARLLHDLSSRSGGSFLKASCAAQPPDQLERSLFGSWPGLPGEHETGLFGSAKNGTLLLDKIADMPFSTQGRLLELLTERDSQQPGHAAPAGAPRLITATDRDIRNAVEEGALRPDLYYRLSVFTLRVPPLRERREDLPYLLNSLMDTWAEAFMRPRLPITRRILDVSVTYGWPGNLRELENFVKRYLVLGEEKTALDQLENGVRAVPGAAPAEDSLQITVQLRSGSLDLKSLMRDIKKDAERAAILEALERTGGNKQKASRLLRISLRSLHYKVRAYGIEPAHARDQGRLELPLPIQHQAGVSAQSGGNCKLLTMDRTLPAAS